MRTRPSTTTYRPRHGSPAVKSTLPAGYDRTPERADRRLSAESSRPANSGTCLSSAGTSTCAPCGAAREGKCVTIVTTVASLRRRDCVWLDSVPLGLVYEAGVDGKNATVTHTLTTPGCPMERIITEGIRAAAGAVPGIERVETRLVWDPAWHAGMIAPGAWGS